MANVFAEASRLLEVAFKAHWDNVGGGVPVKWENVPFQQPTAGPWVEFTVLLGEGQQASLGGAPLEFVAGLVVVSVFHGKDTGTRASRALLDSAAGIRYRQFSGDGVVVDTYEPRVFDAQPHGTGYQSTIQIRFRAQHIAAGAI